MQSAGNSVALVEALHSHAQRDPEKMACICGDQKITYEELDSASRRLAARLLDQGLNPGDRLAIHWPNAIETVQLFLPHSRPA